MHRVNIWVDVLLCLLKTFFGVKSRIFNAEQTVEVLLKGKSLIRFGDGEFGIWRGKDIHYQQWSPALKAAFEAIKSEYEAAPESCPFLLAVPKRFMQCSGVKLMKKRVYVSSWAQSRYDFKKQFKRDIAYGDSFLFEKANKDIYRQLWQGDCPDNVVFVHNNPAYAQHFENTYHKKAYFVQCLPRDAFEQLAALEEQIAQVLKENALNKDNCMLTVSAGPAGKVLVYRFAQMGYWCIDAGHCWDDPLEGI